MTHPTDALRLVPCPFCGGQAEIEQFGNTRRSTIYCCQECGCKLETGEEFNHGRAWNRRAAPASPLPEGGGQCSGISGELSGWQDISSHDGTLKPVLLIAPYPTGTTWSNIIHGWWQPAYVGEDGEIRAGRWARWHHDFPPTHFIQPEVPAAPTGAK